MNIAKDLVLAQLYEAVSGASELHQDGHKPAQRSDRRAHGLEAAQLRNAYLRAKVTELSLSYLRRTLAFHEESPPTRSTEAVGALEGFETFGDYVEHEMLRCGLNPDSHEDITTYVDARLMELTSRQH